MNLARFYGSPCSVVNEPAAADNVASRGSIKYRSAMVILPDLGLEIGQRL